MTEQTAPEDRSEPSFVADERAMLDGWLNYHRRTLLWKCEGLSDEQLKTASVPPSTLTLLGLVRHMAEVERGWFRGRLAGHDVPPLYRSDTDLNADFEDAVPDPDVVAQAWDNWRNEIAFAEQFVAEAPDLDIIGKSGDPLRQVLVHMIEEYARHKSCSQANNANTSRFAVQSQMVRGTVGRTLSA
jgi:uncharacterized damage-inducible protein DinB